MNSQRNILSALLPMAAAVLALGSGCGGTRAGADQSVQDASTSRLLTVAVEPAERASGFRVTREYQGQLEPRRRSRLGFDLAGVVQSVAVDEGDDLAKGAFIAGLDTQRLQVRRRQAAAAVDEAQTSLELAESTLERFQKALERRAVSPQDLDEARRRRDGAQATLRRTQAALDSVDVDLSKSRLQAPYRGVVTQRLADEGEAVAPGQVIVELIELDGPRVRVGVPLEVAARDDLASEVSFVVGDRTVSATRLADLPEQSAETRTVDLLFELDQPLGKLRIGQIARLRLEAPTSGDGFALPTSALTESARGLWSCLVAVPEADSSPESANGRVYVLQRREVEIVELGSQNGEPMVTVRGGLQPGELVVMTGLHRLVPGQRVLLAGPGVGS